MKQQLSFDGPILDGSVSTAWSACGKANCACKGDPPRLHGPYYRWTGVIEGRRTTKTISAETARECERRIGNYRKLQRTIERLVRKAAKSAPWNDPVQKNGTKRNSASQQKDVGN